MISFLCRLRAANSARLFDTLPRPAKTRVGVIFFGAGRTRGGERRPPLRKCILRCVGEGLCPSRGRPQGSPLRRGYKECDAVRNPPVTASPCQPPFRQGGRGDGVRIATASVRTGFAMTWFFMGCGARPGGGVTRGAVKQGVGEIGSLHPPLAALHRFPLRRGGVLPRPYGGVARGAGRAESPSHGLAPFRQGGQGDGGGGLPQPVCALASQ